MTPRKVLEVLRAELGNASPDALELDAVLRAVPDAAGWAPVWDYLVDTAASVIDDPAESNWVALWMCVEHALPRLPVSPAEVVAATGVSPTTASLEACAALCRRGELPGDQLGVVIVRHPCVRRVEAAGVRSVVLRCSRIALAGSFVAGDQGGAARFLAALRGAPAWSPPSWGETGIPLYVRAGLFTSLHESLSDLGADWVQDRATGETALARLAVHSPLQSYAQDATSAAAASELRPGAWSGAAFARGQRRMERLAVDGVERLARARSFGAGEISQPDAHAAVVAALTAAGCLLEMGAPASLVAVLRRADDELALIAHSQEYRLWAQRLLARALTAR